MEVLGRSDEAPKGYMANKKRGTAYLLRIEAIDQFFQINGLSQVIRAHELAHHGYDLAHGGKKITVFSSSRYCNGSNDTACIYVADEKLRPIKLLTRSQTP